MHGLLTNINKNSGKKIVFFPNLEGYSAYMCVEKFPLVSMGGQAEGQLCADPGAGTPIRANGISNLQPFLLQARTFYN